MPLSQLNLNLVKLFLSLALFSLPFSALFAQKTELSLTAIPHTIPILVGLPQNPVVQLVVSNTSTDTINLSRIEGNLNEAALPYIWHIQVFMTGAEPFSPENLLGTFHPFTTHFSIPIGAKITPGLHFIWCSIALKVDADIGGMVELHCTDALDAKGQKYDILEQEGDYRRYKGSVVRHAGDNGVHTYRIPGLAYTDKGTLIAVYDIRYNNSSDLPGDIDVGMSRSLDQGNTWQPMKVIMDMGPPHENNGVGDPAILIDPVKHQLIVAALWSKGNRSIAGSRPGLSPDTTGQIVLSVSSDDGIQWSRPISITSEVKKPEWNLFFQGPGSGIAMQNGTLVFPAQYWDTNKMPFSTLIYSNDHGNTWQRASDGPKSNTTESSIVETTPGTLMLNMRDNRGNFRSIATTQDLGKTWLEHPTSYHTLVDPVCMGSLIKGTAKINGIEKSILFFSNPNDNSRRDNITIKASLDLGETWNEKNQLLIDERPCFGYSSLTIIDEHTIGILYEGNRDLYFVRIPVEDIVK